ncbi:MAG TPA: helix-turn-helix domain-containing protein [Rhizomicrobium sp.]|jgi:AcrR family transcriptional regulator|nr:helix-turn-helix domain-containing protein [Rhizomicrobium sp.]
MTRPDRRPARTRAALMDAFVAALLEDGYDAVSVEAIAARANVGRSTFYTHFKGKDDITRQALARPSAVLAALAAGTLSKEALERQLAHFHEQRRRNRMFFEPPLRAIWVGCLAQLIEPLLRRKDLLLPAPLAARQVAEGQIALIANWLLLRPQTKVETIARALTAQTLATVAALGHDGMS